MNTGSLRWVGAACLCLTCLVSQAQEKFKIGVLSTMSGPAGTFGNETLAGLQLAVKLGGGALGGGAGRAGIG